MLYDNHTAKYVISSMCRYYYSVKKIVDMVRRHKNEDPQKIKKATAVICRFLILEVHSKTKILLTVAFHSMIICSKDTIGIACSDINEVGSSPITC